MATLGINQQSVDCFPISWNLVRSQMSDRFRSVTHGAETVTVADIYLVKFEIATCACLFKIFDSTVRKVVNADNVVPTLEQVICEVRPEKTRRSGYEYFLFRHNIYRP